MSRAVLLMFCLVVGLLVLACGTQDTNRNDTNRNASVTVSAEQQIGVPECDDFLNAYESCISTKVPEVARPQFQATMTSWRAEWKRLAADPQARPGLITACKTHHENARAQMKAYGCTF